MSAEQQEMYDEINVLVGSLARAFEMEGVDAARAVEAGAMVLKLGVDDDGDRYVEAQYQGKIAVVYPGSAKEGMAAEVQKSS